MSWECKECGFDNYDSSDRCADCGVFNNSDSTDRDINEENTKETKFQYQKENTEDNRNCLNKASYKRNSISKIFAAFLLVFGIGLLVFLGGEGMFMSRHENYTYTSYNYLRLGIPGYIFSVGMILVGLRVLCTPAAILGGNKLTFYVLRKNEVDISAFESFEQIASNQIQLNHKAGLTKIVPLTMANKDSFMANLGRSLQKTND